jgi:hypothetical protein
MTHIDPGVKAAKRATWDDDDPRPVAMRIIGAHPTASEADCFDMFWGELLEAVLGRTIETEAPALKSMSRYWFHNVWIAAHARPASAHALGRTRTAMEKATTEQLRSGLKTRVQYEAGLLLLDLTMPNDKPLRDCTREDCLHFGGWLTKLANKIPPKKTVSEVLTEQQVQAVWNTAKKQKL